MNADCALNAVIAIAGLAHLLHTGELFHACKAGKLSLIFVAREVDHRRHDGRVVSWLGRRDVLFASLALRGVASIFVAASFALGIGFWPALAMLCVTTLHYSWFRIVGGDGAEQMALIVVVAAVLVTGPFCSDGSYEIALWFIGGQCLLAYFASGVAKLTSRTWRSGVAIEQITATECLLSYLHPLRTRT